MLTTFTFTATGSCAKTIWSRIVLSTSRFVLSISPANLDLAKMNNPAVASVTIAHERFRNRMLANAVETQKMRMKLPSGVTRTVPHSFAFFVNSPLGTATVDRTVSVIPPLVSPSMSASGESMSLWSMTLCAIAFTSSGIT